MGMCRTTTTLADGATRVCNKAHFNANCPDKLNKVQRQIAVPGARAAVFSFGNDVDDSVEIACRPCGMDMAPVSPTVPAKSMIKVGVWCVVVLFALSIATAVCLGHRNAAPEYDDFVFATIITVDSPITNGDGTIGSFSRIPAWMSAVNSDLAGIDPDSLRPSLQRPRMYAIRTPDETAHSPTCVSAPESIGDRTAAEPTVPHPGTLDFTNVISRITGSLNTARSIKFPLLTSCPRERVAK
jgi:hypothetical protein